MSSMFLGVVLHEEHIELLTADFKQLKKDVAGKRLEEGFLHFTGETETGIENIAQIPGENTTVIHEGPSTTDTDITSI